MKYLMIIATDGIPTPEKSRAMLEGELDRWDEEMSERGVKLLGRPLHPREEAVTVRVRDGETLVSDGPYVEAKEWVAGFDLIDCADLDEAIEVAAKIPVSWFHQIEIRPFRDDVELSDAARAYARGEPAEGPVYAMLFFLDGVPEAPAVEEAIVRDALAWGEDLEHEGKRILGFPLAHKDAATTVRVRDGQTLITDGPFIETREFIGGMGVVRCADREEAIRLAAAHPLARFHAVEVREIWEEEQ
ncbi:MAG: YciI family protein [Solirubrobacteraceae bacterium]